MKIISLFNNKGGVGKTTLAFHLSWILSKMGKKVLIYPHETESLACKEQIRVLSKLVSTGSRLADSIFKCHEEYLRNQQT